VHHQAAAPARRDGHVPVDKEGEAAEHPLLADAALERPKSRIRAASFSS